MRIWAYVALVVVLTGAVGGGLRWAYNSGYNAREVESREEILDAVAQARAEAEKRWAASVVAATEAIKVEERIVESIRVVEKEVPTIVERIVEVTPECADLGESYAGLLNSQIRAGNGIQIASPTDSVDE